MFLLTFSLGKQTTVHLELLLKYDVATFDNGVAERAE